MSVKTRFKQTVQMKLISQTLMKMTFNNFTYVFKEAESLELHSDMNLIIPFLFCNVLLVKNSIRGQHRI